MRAACHSYLIGLEELCAVLNTVSLLFGFFFYGTTCTTCKSSTKRTGCITDMEAALTGRLLSKTRCRAETCFRATFRFSCETVARL